MRKRRPIRAALLAIFALILTACGGGGGGAASDPLSTLMQALERTRTDGAEYTASLESDGSDPALAMAGAVALTGAIHGDNMDINVRALGSNLLAVRVIDGEGYLRIDASAIAALTGESISGEDIQGMIAAGAVPPQAAEALTAVFEGRFLKLPSADALVEGDETGFVDSFIASATDSGDLTEEQARKLASDLQAEFSQDGAIEKYVTVAELAGAEGSTDFSVTLQIRAIMQRVLDVVQDIEPMDADELAEAQADIADAPETLKVMTVTVVDGYIELVAMDLADIGAQLDAGEDAPGVTLKIEFESFGSAPAIEVPTNFVELDPELLGLLSGAV